MTFILNHAIRDSRDSPRNRDLAARRGLLRSCWANGMEFPGAVPVGGDPQIAIWLATAPDSPDAIVTYDHIYQGAPPLEFLRYDQHFGIRNFTIAGAGAEFAAIEQAFQDRNEAERRQPR